MKRVAAILTLICALPATALAQDDFGDEFGDTEETEPMPEPEAEPATEPTAKGESAAAEEESGTSGYFRVDTDSLGTQFWFGATHKAFGIDIASDIYVVGSFAEFDIGPALSFGDLALTPMIGIGFDFANYDVTTLIAPQLFTIWQDDMLYFESWIQFFFNDFLANDDPVTGEKLELADSFYTRNYLLYKLYDELWVGPQVELTYQLNDVDGLSESGLASLPIGGHVEIGYGANNSLGIFVGYDIEGPDGTDSIGGRFTFVRTW